MKNILVAMLNAMMVHLPLSAEDVNKSNTNMTNMTTNQGNPINDDENSQTVGKRGPTLLQDFQFIEKIAHFERERIPERVVHAKGAGAFGYFQVYKAMAKYTKAKFLQDPGKKTPVFVRFSTVAGGRICGHGKGRAGIRHEVLYRGRQLRYCGQRPARLLH